MATPGDLCTISDYRAYAHLEDGDDDTLLKALITRASATIANELGIDFANNTFVDTYNGNGKAVIPLNHKPITGVTSVVIDGVSVPARTTPRGTGFFFSDACLYLAGYFFTQGMQNVVVSYANANVITADLTQACLMMCDLWYKEHDRVGVKSRMMGPGETTVYDKAAWPPAVQKILENSISPGLWLT